MSGGAQLDRSGLAKLLGMLGSEHDGEILNAAKQAERLRQAAGLSWPDLISPALPRPRQREIEDNYDKIRLCQEFAGCLSEWEREFIASISRRPDRLSEKQFTVLQRLVVKCRRAAA